MRQLWLTLLGFLVALLCVSAAASSPRALYQALLGSKFSSSELPRGFYAELTGSTVPGQNAKHHNVIGVVGANIVGNGGAPRLYDIEYEIFPTRRDSLDDWKDADPAHIRGVHSASRAPGFPSPALVLDSSITRENLLNKKVTIRFTTMLFITGSVIVEVQTTGNSDISAILAFGKIAQRHLQVVEGQVATTH
jgi:hypothetical protein